MHASFELHLFIIWSNARNKEREIIEDLKKNLEIVSTYDIQWTRDKVALNFSRFYGESLPKNFFKERECGTGNFLLLVVKDENPKYSYTETLRGTEKVNLNTFLLKQKYRKWTGGGHKVHSTHTIYETNHDASLLLGLNYEDLKKSLSNNYKETIFLQKDLVGTNGWKDLSELFYILNSTVNYVVLRNAEILPKNFKNELHGDIDVLTDNYTELSYVLNATPKFSEPNRVHNYTLVDNQKVYFDIRYIGDNYYCKKFENILFDSRHKNSDDIYVLPDDYLFYSLIYHALIHKRVIAEDYYSKIYNLFVKLGLDAKYDISLYESSFDLYFRLLEKFMIENNLSFTKPIDTSVFYSNNFASVDNVRAYLKCHFNFSNIFPVFSNGISNTYNLFLLGHDEFGQKLFIKANSIEGISRNEYHLTKKLYDIDPLHFVKPIYFRDNVEHGEVGFVASEYKKSKKLKELIDSNKLSTSQIVGILNDILQIFLSLKQSDVVHRDINYNNLIYDGKHLFLIDFQLGVSKSNYKELKFLIANPKLLSGLGTKEFRKKPYCWDDAYSFVKVLEFIGRKPEYEQIYDSVYNEISKEVGKNVIRFRAKPLSRLWWRRIKRMEF